MFEEGFFSRLLGSLDRVLFGIDLLISIIIAFLSYILIFPRITSSVATNFVQEATPLVTTLIIVTVTSVSILVSLSNSEAIVQLKKDQLYEKFLFTFEFTSMLALISSVSGVVIQSIGVNKLSFHFFIFLFTYTILAAATVISRLITYGDKVALISLAESLPDLTEKTTIVRERKEANEEEEQPEE